MEDLMSVGQESDAQVVKSLEEFFSCGDNNFDYVDSERPASAMSFSSWTFSPIPIEECGSNNEDAVEISSVSTGEQLTNQQAVSQTSQPMGNVVTNQPLVEYNSHTNNNVNINAASENVLPGNITYHQSVNIHNYVGNYNVGQGQATWYPAQAQGETLPNMYPVLNNMHQQQQSLIPRHHYVQTGGEHYDHQYTALNTAGQEFNRCSTPDYLAALTSLNQLDSPPKPNYDAATNINYSCMSFNESLHNKSSSSVKHDSGYVSDISESPVVQYANSGASRSQQSHLTSTPQSTGPYKISNVMSLNKENISTLHQHLHGLRFNQPRISEKQEVVLEPKYVKTDNTSQQVNKTPTVPNVLREISQQVPTIDIKSSPKKPQYASMAEFQQAQRSKNTAVKNRKVGGTTASQCNLATLNKQRHNQPLNKTAHDILNAWYTSHIENPYPNKQQKEELAKAGGITIAQVKSWFANKRNRSQNTRPKKQMIQMETRLMDLCHQLARDASKPYTDNAYYIQQLSAILHK